MTAHASEHGDSSLQRRTGQTLAPASGAPTRKRERFRNLQERRYRRELLLSNLGYVHFGVLSVMKYHANSYSRY